jgi:hypothetical protein
VFRVLVKELGYVSGYQCSSMSRESKKAYPGCCETSYPRTNNSDTHVVNLRYVYSPLEARTFRRFSSLFIYSPLTSIVTCIHARHHRTGGQHLRASGFLLNALSEPKRAQNSSIRLAKTSNEPEYFRILTRMRKGIALSLSSLADKQKI